jgi:hypothetical protein
MPIDAAMWQILAEKDWIRVCYQPWENFRSNDIALEPPPEMNLVSGNEIIEIPINGKYSRPWAIRRFINARYGKQFVKADFKSDQQLIDYIVEEEYRRQKADAK